MFIKTVAETIALLDDPRAGEDENLSITDNPADAVKLVRALSIRHVNVANYHKKNASGKIYIHDVCVTDAEELPVFEELAEFSENIVTRYASVRRASEFQGARAPGKSRKSKLNEEGNKLMLTQALLVALSYYLAWSLDSIFGFQTATRPIILGTITGLLCGDLQTGVVMGAALEAVYMGISGIGGVTRPITVRPRRLRSA